jgi:HEAT repeat protein
MNEIPEHIQTALEADDAELLMAIIRQGDPDDFRVFEELARDAETPPEIRRKALYALGRWPDQEEEALEAIAVALPQLDELERIAALDALGRLAVPQAVGVVMTLAEAGEPDIRRSVVQALDSLGTAEALEAVARFAEDDNSEMVRDVARRALQKKRGGKGPKG